MGVPAVRQRYRLRVHGRASYASHWRRVTSLRIMADRIQARAVRRMGELLKPYRASGVNGYNREERVGTGQSIELAAEHAGISPRQRKNAVRVANIPAEQFKPAPDCWASY